MKRFSTFAISRTGIISILSFILLIFSISFVSVNNSFRYKSIDSSISISKIFLTNEDSLVAKQFISDANLMFEDNELSDISDFQFEILVDEFNSNDGDLGTIIRELLNTNNSTRVKFVQQKAMVLPTMKMIHLIGNLNIANITRTVAFQLSYHLDNDHNMVIKGKQAIFLDEFGLKIPQMQINNKNEFIINLNLKMKRDQIEIPRSNMVFNFGGKD